MSRLRTSLLIGMGRSTFIARITVWHAGRGSFKGVDRFARLNVPDDKGNDYFAGCEVVSKGLKKDFTAAQKKSWGLLASAMKEAAGWKGGYYAPAQSQDLGTEAQGG